MQPLRPVLWLSALAISFGCSSKKAADPPPPTAGSGSGVASGSAPAPGSGVGSGSGSGTAGATTEHPSIVAVKQALGIDGPAAPATVDTGATARFALIQSAKTEQIRIYRVEAGALVLESEAELPQATPDAMLVDWEWKDASELVLLFSDGTLRRYAGTKLEPLARPAKKLFEIKKPNGDLRRATDEGLTATATGEVWVHHCAWAYRGDGDPCSDTVHVRVAPAPPMAIGDAPPVRDAPPPLALPAGWSLAIEPVAGGSDKEHGALACKGPQGAKTHAPPPDSAGFSVDDAVVLSTRPPIAVITESTPGAESFVTSERQLAGCELHDLSPRFVVRGPSGFWAIGISGDDHKATVIAWHGRAVATVEDAIAVKFAPSPVP